MQSFMDLTEPSAATTVIGAHLSCTLTFLLLGVEIKVARALLFFAVSLPGPPLVLNRHLISAEKRGLKALS